MAYGHGYDAQKLYPGLALDPKYVDDFVEGCLWRGSARTIREGGDREIALEILQSRL